MKTRLFLGWCSVALFGTINSGQACSQTAAPSARADVSKLQHDGESRLEEGRTLQDEQTLMEARKIFSECVLRDEQNALCYYDLARAEGYLEQVRQLQKDKNAAETWIDSAIKNAQHSLALNE